TVFPHFLFWWQGVDGTRLLTYLPPASYDTSLPLLDTAKGISRYEATTGLRESLLLWGMGDHGGGPNREVLDRVKGYAGLPFAPRFSHERADDFLTRMERTEGKRIPVLADELYLEYHQGTFTTQGAIKAANRRSEQMAQTAEKAAATAALAGFPYPAEPLRSSWKTLLTNQFHDILPGSSITPVYRDALEDHARIQQTLARVTREALEGIASRIDTSAVRGRPLLVYNPLSWPRADLLTVRFPRVAGEEWHVEDSRGTPVPAEIGWHDETGEGEATFVTGRVPALGYEVYALVPGVAADHEPGVPVEDWTVENRHLRLTLDPRTGEIAGLVDRTSNRPLIRPGQGGNALWVVEDRPERWDAWNIGYTGRCWKLEQAETVEVLRSTPVRTTFRVKKSFLGLSKDRSYPTENFPSSFFTQDITVYRDLDRVDIETVADWWEDHLALKAVFPTTVEAERAAYEIPFAAIERSARRRTLAEKARYEVPALRWADLSDARGGLSLLNDGKYGHDIHDGVMTLSLLRSPTYPDALADRGKHRFTYALYPHPGSWGEGETVQHGAELNAPLQAVWTGLHEGSLPLARSLASVSPAAGDPLRGVGVIVDTLKAAETGGGIVLRLYESRGEAERVVLELADSPRSARLTDLLEGGGQAVPVDHRRIALSFRPFEIKTLVLEYL
ncbi:MAG TPA: glycoside hydrolase family 38 C-terminal domain-containing protein, partial [Candidatus Aminicenantes bacterium]|nr:glycoside hydrolase family 38 C-terminal domain-containing protein [Candidatus Aminicenantes bacterium]